VPLYNEADGLTEFAARLREVLDCTGMDYEVILVNDGSQDDTAAVARSLGWPAAQVATLARNVGHQAAIDAGLSLTHGEFVLTMDGDGQHPPELIPRLLDAARDPQVDIVYTVQRSRESDPRGKRLSALAYYRLMRWLTGVPIEDSQADFRLVRRRVLGAIADVPGDRVLRLLLPSVGFTSTTIAYVAEPRIAGHGRFGFRRQMAMARQSLMAFSSKPLRLVASIGFVLSFLSLAWFVVVVVTYATQRTIVGWTSVMTAVLLVGGLTLLSLSVVGSYVARIHDMMKGHPRYYVDRVDPADQ
jgi:dolichol-phosphate mannosyltransferase